MFIKQTLLLLIAVLTCFAVSPTYAGDVAITSFSASPSTITAGDSTTISWATENATSCTPSGGTGGWSQQSIALPSGNAAIVIATAADYYFTLTCQGATGNPSVAQIKVIVIDLQSDIISCDSFESCPEANTSALEARIEALEALLAGATRGIDPGTSQDTLSFGNSTSSDTVLVRELSTTNKEANLPVCFNGAGELLPCADGVEPPPVGDPYLGSWTGRMIYDRRSTGQCHDADVYLIVSSYNSSLDKIGSLVVIRDSGGLDNVGEIGYITIETGASASQFSMFYSEIGTSTDYSLQFSTQGSAQGYWNYYNGDCYGQWSFTKD